MENRREAGHFKNRIYMQWPKSTKRMVSVEILRLCCHIMAGIWGNGLRESVQYAHDAKAERVGQNHKDLDILGI